MPDRSEVEAVPREFVPVDFADAFIRVHPWHPCSNWMRSRLAGRGCESGDFCGRVLSDETWIFEQVGGANGDEPVSPVAIAVSEAAHPRRSPFSFGGSARMTTSTHKLTAFLGLPVVAAVATFVTLMIAASVVSGLPRPMQGESVRAPWSVCILGSVGLSLLLPWLASLPLVRLPRLRVYFLLCLVVAVSAWW